MSVNPTNKAKDYDFSAMMYKAPRSQVCTCTCACCVSGHGAPGGASVSPLGERPLGCEPEGIAAEALERRYRLITEVLLPEAKTLAASLAKANEKGTIGFGELEILGTLQHWVLQLQIEQDELRLCLAPPDLAPKAP